MIFKDININSKIELDAYFNLVDYEACEYSFTTLYMWQSLYNTRYSIEENFAVIVEEHEGNTFSILPLATIDNLPKVIDITISNFEKEGKKIHLRDATKEIVNYLQDSYKGKFKYIKDRDSFDYIYDADSLRTLQGRKYKNRRNHINTFLKDYEGRYKYKLLNKDNLEECLNLMNIWMYNKQLNNKFQHSMEYELLGIKKVFLNYDKLKENVKIAGIYIDEKLEAFTIGEKLNDNMALIHIEKANPNIRGLYTFINQQFLINEFKDVEFVNREDDLGIKELRETKLTYHPCRFVEKYTITEINM